MCGICAIINPESAEGVDINAMVEALRHRGPDAQTHRRVAGADLGHARLSIIDLAGGDQPMSDETQRRWIVFNGELYNYRELRADLMRSGMRFRTQSDTEVVLAAYAAWGARCLDRFRGMFAFVIWDTAERRVFAARDIFGEKPLYYLVTPSRQLMLASEIKSILAVRRNTARLDPQSVDAYLALGYVPPDRTIYREIHTLPPGHYLEWNGHGVVRTSCYWRPVFNLKPVIVDEAAERLRTLLGRAVRRQMVADVPVGAFLSGGHDSSTIVALMAEHATEPVRTFSVGFGDWINELPYARAVASRYRTEHHDVDLGAPAVAPLLERMAEVYDEPFMDPSHIPTFLIAQYARRHVKVVLTGDGADELFGGYGWYPLFAASIEASGALLVWLLARSASRLLGDRVRPLARYSQAQSLARRWSDPWTRYVEYRAVFDTEERARLWGTAAPIWTPRHYRPESIGGMDSVLHFDLTAFLPGDILVKVDRAAMAHGLETRAPFLDRDLVEFALALPAQLKVTPERTKILFKSALQRYWPPALHARGKQGFAAPHHVWLGRPDVQVLVRRVFRPQSVLRRLLPGIGAGIEHERGNRTWNLLTLGLWLERHESSL